MQEKFNMLFFKTLKKKKLNLWSSTVGCLGKLSMRRESHFIEEITKIRQSAPTVVYTIGYSCNSTDGLIIQH